MVRDQENLYCYTQASYSTAIFCALPVLVGSELPLAITSRLKEAFPSISKWQVTQDSTAWEPEELYRLLLDFIPPFGHNHPL